jgi:hypothetical protein
MCKPLSVSLLHATLFISLSIAAQSKNEKNIPEFGKVDKTELELKECEFDKNAEALVLFDGGELYGNDYGNIELKRHIRIKILKDKGLEQANIKILFHAFKGDESVKKLEAQTYNLDASGNVVATKVEKKLVYEKKLNKRYSEMIFTFPEAKAGSVIEYKYTITGAGLRNWYFQRSIPVRYSRYTTQFPVEFEVHSQPLATLPYTSERKGKANHNVQTFTMENIPALRDEPFITCEDDYLQRVESRLIAYNYPTRRVNLLYTWPEVIKELMDDEDFGVQLRKEIPRTADLDAELKTRKSAYEKMLTIHRYVRKNMEWNGYDNIWALDGVKSAWKDKKGTSGEINLILINLLKDAGLDAYPVLVSTREHGMIDQVVPSIKDFDKVMAYVKISEGGKEKTYVLDATDKFNPSQLIPYDVMYSEGLVIEKLDTRQWGWKLLWDENKGFTNMVLLQADIDKEGMMKGKASVNSFDYTRVSRVPDLKKGKDKYLEEYFTSPNPVAKVDSFAVTNEDNDSLPLIQEFRFTEPVQSSGEYKYFSINKFSGLEKNPFVADTRFSDVFFGAKRNYMIVGNFSIPDDYSFEELPKNLRMILPDTSISLTRMSSVSGNRLSVRVNLEFKKPFYTVAEYADFKEFYKKLFDILNEQFVVRKKSETSKAN